jgi:hypothetical protein
MPGLGQRKERDEADGWGPLVSARGERRRLTWKMQTRKANIFLWGCHRRTGQMSQRGKSWASQAGSQ